MHAAGDETPAVASLLAGRLDRDGFVATLMDLSARGWFRLSPPGGPAQSGGPVMCVLAAQPPAQWLAPYERRVAAHVALRAGARGEVPAPALRDGFHGGEAEFMTGFRDEVMAEAQQRGLARARFGGFGTGRRPTEAGRAVLDRARVTAAGGGGRAEAYAAALGLAPPTAAAFARARKNLAWSSYRGGWRQIEIETTTWPWWRIIVLLLVMICAPGLYVSTLIWLWSIGMTGLAVNGAWLVPVAVGTCVVVWLAGRARFPRLVEFDGQVIRQWVAKGDDETPDQYHVAVDDGVRDQAWDLDVGSERYAGLPPGTFVRVRVNLRNRGQVSTDPVKPPPRYW